MEQWIPALITAILGGTGLASLISGGARLTLRTRLKNRIDTLHGAVSKATLPVTKRALTEAIERDSMRLAALSIVRPNSIWFAGALVVSAASATGLVAALSFTTPEVFAEMIAWKPLNAYDHPGELFLLSLLACLVFAPWLLVLAANSGTRAAWVNAQLKAVREELDELPAMPVMPDTQEAPDEPEQSSP